MISFSISDIVNITSYTLVQPNENHTAGAALTRECIARGYPTYPTQSSLLPIDIIWYLDSVRITHHTIVTTIVDEGVDYAIVKSVITINTIDGDDRGVLECIANNSIGSDSESTNVHVLCKLCLYFCNSKLFVTISTY